MAAVDPSRGLQEQMRGELPRQPDARAVAGWRVAAGFAIVWAAFVGSYMAADAFLIPVWRLGEPGETLLEGIAPAVLGILAAIVVECWISGTSIQRGMRLLGLGPPPGRALLVALLASLPFGVFYAIHFGWDGVPVRMVPLLPLQVGKFVLAQGIAEEVLFRGFLFRHLRVRRSFAGAATISACVFSVSHLANLVHGVSSPVLVRVGISLVFGVILTYPATYLFEKGRRTIWGFGLVHVAIDSVDWFVGIAGSAAIYWYMLAVGACAGCVFLLGALMLPPLAREPS